MNRIEFTKKIANLLAAMFLAEENPILDYALRSQEEQHRLWQIGRDKDGNKIGSTVTNCDGYKNISAHQTGHALDIGFIENNVWSTPKKGWKYWHDYWVSLGGKQEINWDEDHFEG
jgi:LAS superfamily LD-carboxypeptidase LdcB